MLQKKRLRGFRKKTLKRMGEKIREKRNKGKKLSTQLFRNSVKKIMKKSPQAGRKQAEEFKGTYYKENPRVKRRGKREGPRKIQRGGRKETSWGKGKVDGEGRERGEQKKGIVSTKVMKHEVALNKKNGKNRNEKWDEATGPRKGGEKE